MKKSAFRSQRLRASISAAAILTGAFAFTGEADAVVILTENFEADTNAFSMPTYTYAAGYTLPNLLVPGGDLVYAHGGAGVNGAETTNTFSAAGNPLSLTTGGVTAEAIDAGTILFNFSAQFSTYQTQNDWASVTLTFLNGGNGVISEFSIGSSALVQSLPTGVAAPVRGWASDALDGLVPVGARSVEIVVDTTKTPAGVNIDGYLDNVNFEINAVPEPATITLAGIAAAGLLRRRRS